LWQKSLPVLKLWQREILKGVRMSHFAKVENGIVTQVIVIEQEQLNTGNWGDPSLWIQTSYNTRGNVHYLPNSWTPSGNTAFRGNYAGVGMIYDKENDVFYMPQPYPSWVLDKSSWTWKPPIKMPEVITPPIEVDGVTVPGIPKTFYNWDEETLSWKEYITPLGYVPPQ
jgi:hypothetical protein